MATPLLSSAGDVDMSEQNSAQLSNCLSLSIPSHTTAYQNAQLPDTAHDLQEICTAG